MTEWEKYGNN
jgi:hypothetical protein